MTLPRYPLRRLLCLWCWLGAAAVSCTSSSSPMQYSFPTDNPFSPAEVKQRFGVVTVEQDPDSAIHYKLVIPLQWGQVSGTRRLVTPEHPLELRSHFKSLAEPVAEAKVTVAYVPEEVAPADWLALYLEQHQERVLHERYLPSEGGATPDVLTIGGEAGQERISRWTVLKDHAKIGGAHLFMLQATTAARDYSADMANVFYLAVSNFDVLHPTGWAYAEQLRTLVRAVPLPFTTAYPLSWQPVENPASDEHFYQVKLLKYLGGQQAGQLSLALLAGQAEADVRRLEEEDRAALAAAGLEFAPTPLGPGPVLPGGHSTLAATVPQTSGAPGQPLHERTVLLGHLGGQRWVYADCLSPDRRHDPLGWAVSTRALAIVLEHLKIG